MTIIGIYHPIDPFFYISSEKLQALLFESKKQKVVVYFFNEKEVDFDQGCINGMMVKSGKKKVSQFPMPDVIINLTPWDEKKYLERHLHFHYQIPFTLFEIDTKEKINDILLSTLRFSSYVIPTHILKDINSVDEMLLKYNNKIVIKPNDGSRGRGIYSITYNLGIYHLQYQNNCIQMDREYLIKRLRIITKIKIYNKYIIQPYISSMTPENEPYDFRIFVQRGENGEFKVCKIYPKIGIKDSITSNLATGGRTEDLFTFLRRIFPKNNSKIPAILHDLGIDLSEFISSYYSFNVSELGFDVTIDSENKGWLFEINTLPSTDLLNEAWAKHAIGYAKYLSKQTLKS